MRRPLVISIIALIVLLYCGAIVVGLRVKNLRRLSEFPDDAARDAAFQHLSWKPPADVFHSGRRAGRQRPSWRGNLQRNPAVCLALHRRKSQLRELPCGGRNPALRLGGGRGRRDVPAVQPPRRTRNLARRPHPGVFRPQRKRQTARLQGPRDAGDRGLHHVALHAGAGTQAIHRARAGEAS